MVKIRAKVIGKMIKMIKMTETVVKTVGIDRTIKMVVTIKMSVTIALTAAIAIHATIGTIEIEVTETTARVEMIAIIGKRSRECHCIPAR